MGTVSRVQFAMSMVGEMAAVQYANAAGPMEDAVSSLAPTPFATCTMSEQ